MSSIHHAASRASASKRKPAAAGHPRSVANVKLPEEGRADPDVPFEEGAHSQIDPDLRHRLISEAAFHRYESRGFADGYELDDWLAAESEVDQMLLNPQYAQEAAGGG
jgi:hypothetical protein